MKRARSPRRILVLDVGGTHVKCLATGRRIPVKIDSGPKMNPRRLVAEVLRATKDWRYDAIAIGYPGPVAQGKPVVEPHNLAPGWVGFDFKNAFHKPVRIVNDAAMQALGAYRGGRMLFLGLGTGLGSAMIAEGILEPLELAHLPYKKATFEDSVGERALLKTGKRHWRKEVFAVVGQLRAALEPDYVVIGGGNVRLLKKLPKGCERGDNADAFTGGYRLWQDRPAPAPHRRHGN